MLDPALIPYVLLAISGCVVALMFILIPKMIKANKCINEFLRELEENRPE
jgi:hypothetical protein